MGSDSTPLGDFYIKDGNVWMFGDRLWKKGPQETYVRFGVKDLVGASAQVEIGLTELRQLRDLVDNGISWLEREEALAKTHGRA